MTDNFLSDDFFSEEDSYIRDRIIILGRRSSGKTVYLSALYHKLWNSKDGAVVKAIKGTSHVEFLKNVDSLQKGQLPPATQGMSENILELRYKGQANTIVALDYPGEVFTNAFVKEVDTIETGILLEHIDHAKALIVLVDPGHVIDGDIESKIDNDYGLIQAINRIQNWPDAKKVPIVLVLTKADIHSDLIKKTGGTQSFIQKHFSNLIRDVHGVKGCRISAFAYLKEDKSKIAHVDLPLKYCLDKISHHQEEEKQEKLRLEKIEQNKRLQEMADKLNQEKLKQDQKKLRIIYGLWAIGIFMLGCFIKAILPSTVWGNLWYNTIGHLFKG